MTAETAQLVASLDDALSSAVGLDALLAAAEHDGEPARAGDVLALVGWPMLAIAEDHGGTGLDGRTRAELYALAGHHLLPTAHRVEAALLGPALSVLARTGTAHAGEVLAELEAGRLTGSGAVLQGPLVESVRAGSAVWGGSVAELCVVVGDDRAVVLRLGSTPRATLPAAAEPGQGLALVHASELAAGWMLDDPAVVASLRAEWRLACIAECVGLADRMLRTSLRHASEREQFGRPLVAFQAVAHRLADMASRVELARSVLGRLAHDPASVGSDVGAAAEALVPAYAREVCESAIQVHGGMGFSWESGLHLAYRRALSIGLEFGGNEHAAVRVGERLVRSRRERRHG